MMVLTFSSGIFLLKRYTNRVIHTLFFVRVCEGSRIPEVVESHEMRNEKYNIGCKAQVMYLYRTGFCGCQVRTRYARNGSCDVHVANPAHVVRCPVPTTRIVFSSPSHGCLQPPVVVGHLSKSLFFVEDLNLSIGIVSPYSEYMQYVNGNIGPSFFSSHVDVFQRGGKNNTS